MRRNYVVHCKRGRVSITVDTSIIDLRGERYAVAQAAWQKLMGENSLGELNPGKAPPTRDDLMDEIFSRPAYMRDDVFWTFHDKINFTLISLGD